MRYILMNKDKPLLRFHCEVDEFQEVEAVEDEWFDSIRPIGYSSLTRFLERRKAPKHRKHIEELLERYGCNDLEGFLQVTHALSLNDTFWVKEEKSNLRWADVSLYENDFNELIAAAAFDGRFSDSGLSSTSPEFGTDGQYAKCWVREAGSIFLYKSGSDTFNIEPLSEYLAFQVTKLICPNAVCYDLAFFRNRLVSKCELFTSEKIGLVKAFDIFPTEDRTVAKMCRHFDEIGAGDAFRRMCVLDALILNTDRHLGNFGVLVDNKTMHVLSMAPVFDHNRSLLFDFDSTQLKQYEWCINTCKPRFGVDFVTTAKALLTEEIREDLEKMRGFCFYQHPSISVDQERLDLLSRVVNYQVERVLQDDTGKA